MPVFFTVVPKCTLAISVTCCPLVSHGSMPMVCWQTDRRTDTRPLHYAFHYRHSQCSKHHTSNVWTIFNAACNNEPPTNAHHLSGLCPSSKRVASVPATKSYDWIPLLTLIYQAEHFEKDQSNFRGYFHTRFKIPVDFQYFQELQTP